MKLEISFESYAEDRPGPRWKAVFDRTWANYRGWFLRSDAALRPGYVECRRALRDHMPEFVPVWQELVALSGGSDLEARFLSMWSPPRYITGCAQTIWIDPKGLEAPVLLRNYDFVPNLIEGTWTATRWAGQRVVAVSDCLCGALDGMNEAGLAASLSFGGREAYGPGFGVPLILRYVLECAETTAEAIKILARLPSSMSYTIALLDKQGDWATVFISPDRQAEATRKMTSTNVQREVEWIAHSRATRAVERLQCLEKAVATASVAEDVLAALLQPPLLQTNYRNGYGTLYTAAYCPTDGQVELRWPSDRWVQTVRSFSNDQRSITLVAPG